MQFQYYNPVEEKGGCVVRALSKAFDKEYELVKQELISLASSLNYEDYREIEVFEKYLLDHGAKKENVRNIEVEALKDKKGTYVVFAYKDDFYHLACIIDGVLYDKKPDIFDLVVLNLYKVNENEKG